MTDPHGADSAEIERLLIEADQLLLIPDYSQLAHADMIRRLLAALRTPPDDAVYDRLAIEAETYRDMHEIATERLGYPSILEALEAAPHAMFDTPDDAVKLREAWAKVSNELDNIPGGMHAALKDAASDLWRINEDRARAALKGTAND